MRRLVMPDAGLSVLRSFIAQRAAIEGSEVECQVMIHGETAS